MNQITEKALRRSVNALDWAIFHIKHRLRHRKDLFTDCELRCLEEANKLGRKELGID